MSSEPAKVQRAIEEAKQQPTSMQSETPGAEMERQDSALERRNSIVSEGGYAGDQSQPNSGSASPQVAARGSMQFLREILESLTLQDSASDSAPPHSALPFDMFPPLDDGSASDSDASIAPVLADVPRIDTGTLPPGKIIPLGGFQGEFPGRNNLNPDQVKFVSGDDKETKEKQEKVEQAQQPALTQQFSSSSAASSTSSALSFPQGATSTVEEMKKKKKKR